MHEKWKRQRRWTSGRLVKHHKRVELRLRLGLRIESLRNLLYRVSQPTPGGHAAGGEGGG